MLPGKNDRVPCSRILLNFSCQTRRLSLELSDLDSWNHEVQVKASTTFFILFFEPIFYCSLQIRKYSHVAVTRTLQIVPCPLSHLQRAAYQNLLNSVSLSSLECSWKKSWSTLGCVKAGKHK